jgi:protein-disulfide isomerase
MTKRPLLRRVSAIWLAVFLLMILPLAACGGAAQPVSEEANTSAEMVEDAPADAEAVEEATEVESQEEIEETAATEEEVPAEEAEATQDDENLLLPGSTEETECQSIDIPDNQVIAAVSENDWVIGPADAPVTIVEYSDFQ